MNKRILVPAFLVVVAIQLLIPAVRIAAREKTLNKGRVFKFRTAPVDPYDAFRGRYVALKIEQDFAGIEPGNNFKKGEKVYAIIRENPDGFAYVKNVSREQPASQPHLRTRVRSTSDNRINLEMPFEQFYMDEFDAPAAERAYRQANSPSNQSAYVQVRIMNGDGVIENLYIDGVPIREYLAASTDTQ